MECTVIIPPENVFALLERRELNATNVRAFSHNSKKIKRVTSANLELVVRESVLALTEPLAILSVEPALVLQDGGGRNATDHVRMGDMAKDVMRSVTVIQVVSFYMTFAISKFGDCYIKGEQYEVDTFQI